MPFDPAKPAANSPNSSAEMRAQLTALNDRIVALETALPATAQNPSLSPLSLALSDPPTRVEVQQILDFLNTLVSQITRV